MMTNYNQQVADARAELFEKNVFRPITGSRRNSIGAANYSAVSI
jgi:hypothetical protein